MESFGVPKGMCWYVVSIWNELLSHDIFLSIPTKIPINQKSWNRFRWAMLVERSANFATARNTIISSQECNWMEMDVFIA